nr:hypothetical protein CFP56_67356 [Quercus suber]
MILESRHKNAAWRTGRSASAQLQVVDCARTQMGSRYPRKASRNCRSGTDARCRIWVLMNGGTPCASKDMRYPRAWRTRSAWYGYRIYISAFLHLRLTSAGIRSDFPVGRENRDGHDGFAHPGRDRELKTPSAAQSAATLPCPRSNRSVRTAVCFIFAYTTLAWSALSS